MVARWGSPRHGAVPGASCSVSTKQRQISVGTGQELLNVHRQKMGQQQEWPAVTLPLPWDSLRHGWLG